MGTGVTSEWIDCGYCQTRHIAFCGFAANDDSDATQRHPNGDRKWVTYLLAVWSPAR